MRLMKRRLVLSAAIAFFAGSAWGAPFSVEEDTALFSADASIDLVSSYIFRGVTLNKNESVQPGVEAAIKNLTIGAWGSFAMDPEDEEGEKEADIYVSYSVPLNDVFTINVGAIEYIYPESDADNDREVSIGIEIGTLLSPSLAANFGLDGALEDSNYYELGLSQDTFSSGDLSTSLGLLVGYLDPAESKAGVSHVQLIASASYKFVHASANYFVETDDEVQSFEDSETYFLSLGTAYSF